MVQSCRNNNKIAIVGGGPAGIYCALNILFEFKKINFTDFKIDIFDKTQVLRTILPTGASRCNITNAEPDLREFCSNYPRGEKFLYSIFSRHFNHDSIDFFKSIGVETYIQQDFRVFPKSNSSKDVKDKMLDALFKFKNAKLIQREIKSAKDLENYDKIVVCAGSRGTEKLIQSFKHTCIPFKKALCALEIENFNFPCGVSVNSLDGDFIFTQNGISGPLAFKISSLRALCAFPYEIEITLFNYEDLIDKIKKNPKKSIGNLVCEFVARSLAKVIVKNYDKKAAEVSVDEIKKISKLNLRVISASKNGEIVNAGGVELDELDKNCKSRLNQNLWFCGEILNIDGFCGGFNLQNCWSSAYVVAHDVVCSIIKK